MRTPWGFLGKAPGCKAGPENNRDEGEGMKVVCAWCGKLIRDGSEPTSHGICPLCEEKELQNYGSKHGRPGQGTLGNGSTNNPSVRGASEELIYFYLLMVEGILSSFPRRGSSAPFFP